MPKWLLCGANCHHFSIADRDLTRPRTRPVNGGRSATLNHAAHVVQVMFGERLRVDERGLQAARLIPPAPANCAPVEPAVPAPGMLESFPGALLPGLMILFLIGFRSTTMCVGGTT